MGKLVNKKAIVLLQSHAKSISVHAKYYKPKKFSKHNIVMRDPFVTHTRWRELLDRCTRQVL